MKINDNVNIIIILSFIYNNNGSRLQNGNKYKWHDFHFRTIGVG